MPYFTGAAFSPLNLTFTGQQKPWSKKEVSIVGVSHKAQNFYLNQHKKPWDILLKHICFLLCDSAPTSQSGKDCLSKLKGLIHFAAMETSPQSF